MYSRSKSISIAYRLLQIQMTPYRLSSATNPNDVHFLCWVSNYLKIKMHVVIYIVDWLIRIPNPNPEMELEKIKDSLQQG